MRASSAGKSLLIGGLLILAAIGLYALWFRLQYGIGITHLGTGVPWGLWVSFYIYFIGLSAGSFLLSTLVFVFRNKKLESLGRLAVLQAFVCLLVGLAFISIDLGHIERFWHVIRYPQWHSVLAWEIWFYNIYIVILFAELFFLMRRDLAARKNTSRGLQSIFYSVLSLGFRIPATDDAERAYARKNRNILLALGIIGIPVALGVHGGTGAIFAVVKARAMWFTPLFPLVFIVSALASGGGLLLFLKPFLMPDKAEDRVVLPELAKLTMAFLGFDLFLMMLEFLVGFYGDMHEHIAAYQLILFGNFWWVFWIQQLLFGAMIPLFLVFIKGRSAGPVRFGIAGLLVAVGIFGVRLNIIIPALAVPILPGIDHAINSARLDLHYVPNAIEWLSSLGIIALAALVFYLLMNILPVRERASHTDDKEAADVCP